MLRTLLISLVLLLAVPRSSALAAEEASWNTTLPAEAVATYLDGPPARYMVVPAGTEAPELAQAEQALAAALRNSGKAVLVMNAQALGPVAQLDDAAIVQRGAGFPVDRVMVLRLFPDASGALTQAVVTLYDTAGQPRGSFFANQGTALAPRPQAPEQKVASASEPTPPPAPANPPPAAPARPSKPKPLTDPVEQYEQQYIGFDEFVALNGQTGTVVAQTSLPYEGKFKRPLQGDAFYKKVGREDLVQAYQGKIALKTVIGIAGGAALVGGAIFGINGLNAGEEDCAGYDDYAGSSACFDRNWARQDEQRAKFLTGLGISTAGIVALAAAILINPHPVTASEARELADGYNKKLKTNLGLSEDGTPIAPPERPAAIQARFSPVFRPDGGGLMLSGTF
ncbi:hypothetical protein JQX13_22465 [Archangium violaceum]|uniref:hypothetical protein n=1 Tax=Archangium violaceum TaxID=83451 RepID=UPI00193B77EB|nr:hypothetical protein [Archangium violaceum]QRK12544.1 hypothetical protein JQX13_22465 [Archangium violaceum]